MAEGQPSHGQHRLTDRELLAIAHAHIIPALPARALGRLACTCSFMHALVHDASMQVWQAAAAEVLPRGHAACRTGKDRQAIQAALSRHGQVHHCLKQGTWKRHRLPNGAHMPSISPDGFHMVFKGDPQGTVLRFCKIEQGQLIVHSQEWRIGLSACWLRWLGSNEPGRTGQACRIIVAEFDHASRSEHNRLRFTLLDVEQIAAIQTWQFELDVNCFMDAKEAWRRLSCQGGFWTHLHHGPRSPIFQPLLCSMAQDDWQPTYEIYGCIFHPQQDHIVALLHYGDAGVPYITIHDLVADQDLFEVPFMAAKQGLPGIELLDWQTWGTDTSLLAAYDFIAEKVLIVTVPEDNVQIIWPGSRTGLDFDLGPHDIRLSTNGHLASLQNHSVDIWSVERQQVVFRLRERHSCLPSSLGGYDSDTPWSVAWSPDGSMLAAGHFLAQVIAICMHEASGSWSQLARIPAPGLTPLSTAWSPSGMSLAYHACAHLKGYRSQWSASLEPPPHVLASQWLQLDLAP